MFFLICFFYTSQSSQCRWISVVTIVSYLFALDLHIALRVLSWLQYKLYNIHLFQSQVCRVWKEHVTEQRCLDN